MRSLIPWRSRFILWLFAPGLILIALFARQFFDRAPYAGYWPGVTAASAIFLLIPCAVVAVCGALEGSRTRRGRLSEIPTARPRVAIVVQQMWPVLLGGVVLQIVAVGLVARGTWGAPGTPDFRVILTFVAILFFHAALGYLLGVATPLAVSVPVSLLLSYIWLGFTWASTYFPLRYLAGLAISSCCRSDYVMDPRALVSASLFSVVAGVALFVCAIAALRGRSLRSVVAVGTAIGLTVVATVGGIAIARPLGGSPMLERTADDLQCSGHAPQICLFPELLRYTDPRPALTAAWSSLNSEGVHLPARIVSSERATTVAQISMGLRPVETREQVVQSFVTAILQPELYRSGCKSGDELRRKNSSVILIWLSSHVGQGEVPGPSWYADGTASATKLAELPSHAQVEWVNANIPALTNCALSPSEVPSR